MSKEWKQKRADVLYVREQSYFHSTMVEIEKLKKIEELEKQKLEILSKIEELKVAVLDIENQVTQIRSNVPKTQSDLSDGFSIRACSISSCKGFLEKRTGVCMLCRKKTCLSCNVECVEEHECQQDDLNTWMEIKRHSKPCPNCATRISKIDGCSQMWCPNCHKAFNWNTGKIETGVIHNPHYFQFLDRNPEFRQHQQDMNVCRNVWNYYRYHHLFSQTEQTEFTKIFGYLSDLINHKLVRLRTQHNRDNLDIRIQFLLEKMDETKFKKLLVKREIQYNKQSRIIDIYDTIDVVFRNILNSVFKKQITFDQFLIQYRELMKYTNESIDMLNTTFSSKIQHLIVY
jgi:hypothetical protein